jgi:hypothetical protein
VVIRLDGGRNSVALRDVRLHDAFFRTVALQASIMEIRARLLPFSVVAAYTPAAPQFDV